MEPYLTGDRFKLFNGDCREVLASLDSESVSSCVTDPPYLIRFMNRKWDASGITFQVALWEEVYRVLKPGAHLLAFAATRTYHRMAVAIEDAGFEIRDSIHWMYGSGFPKSLDVSKAIDKAVGAKREVIGSNPNLEGRHIEHRGNSYGQGYYVEKRAGQELTAPATEAARQWSGWGTALKPAHEIICLARKPLSEPNVAANVLKWGTGAINVDGCRISSIPRKTGTRSEHAVSGVNGIYGADNRTTRQQEYDQRQTENPQGRWPSNVVLSHDPNCNSQCVEGCPVQLLDQQSGDRPNGYRVNPSKTSEEDRTVFGRFTMGYEHGERGYEDNGGASRFFHVTDFDEIDYPAFYYCAKANRVEREDGLERAATKTLNRVNPGGLENEPRFAPLQVKNNHPTVKPVALLRYLIRLITPASATCIDPFAGSGSCGVAALAEDCQFIGIEQDVDSCEIAKHRLLYSKTARMQRLPFAKPVKTPAKQGELFSGEV